MEETNAPLVLRQFGGTIEVTQDAWNVRRQALDAARPIYQVKTAQEQLAAVEALRLLRALRTEMEATRKSVKAPVLALGRKIDSTANDFLAEAQKEESRLQGLINHFQRKQLEEQRAEEDRIALDAKHAEQLGSEAEKIRHEAVFEEDPALRAELLRKADQLDAAALDAKLTVEVFTQPEIDKPKGLVVRNRINFQVTDPIQFVQAYPQFWKWHEKDANNKPVEILKLDRMRVLDELNKEHGLFRRTHFPEELSSGEDQRLVRPAGLRVFEETKAHVR